MTGTSVLRRLAGFLLTLLAIATVSFFLLRVAPGAESEPG